MPTVSSPTDKDIPPVPASAASISQIEQSPEVLAPKMASAATHDVTADSGDLKSLLPSPDVQQPSPHGNLLNVSAHSLVTMFAEAMTTIINDVKDLPRILNHHRSPGSTVTSLPTSPGAHVPYANQVSAGSQGHYPTPSAPPQPSSSVHTDLSNKVSLATTKPVFPNGHLFAQGPPTDPDAFEAMNFASRKTFHEQKAASLDYHDQLLMQPSVPDVTPLTSVVPPQAPTYQYKTSVLSQTPIPHTAPPQSSSVPSVTHSPSLYEDPILAPKMVSGDTSDKPSTGFCAPTPKPMISFDMAKWAKQIHAVRVKEESYTSVLAWYDTIQQSMIISTGQANIMPDVEHLTKSFEFAHHILPGRVSSVFKAGYIQYVAMAKALRLHIVHPDTISTNCSTLIVERDLHDSNKDGFILLMKLLGSIFPHLGGPHVDMIKEITSLHVTKSETFDSLLYKFVKLRKKLILSGHQVPATALFEKYLSILRMNDRVFSLLSPIHRSFHDHISAYGPDVEFMQYSFPDVHKYIKKSGIRTDSLLSASSSPKKQSFAQTHAAEYWIPQANAASYPHLDENDHLVSQDIPNYPQANAAVACQYWMPQYCSSQCSMYAAKPDMYFIHRSPQNPRWIYLCSS